jgi:hypothetical protein
MSGIGRRQFVALLGGAGVELRSGQLRRPWSPCGLCGSTRFGPRFQCTASYSDQSEAAARGIRHPTAMPE